VTRFDDDSWIVCVHQARVVTDGFVECPIARSSLASTLCLACRHLETLSGERDPVHGCTSGEQRPTAGMSVGW